MFIFTCDVFIQKNGNGLVGIYVETPFRKPVGHLQCYLKGIDFGGGIPRCDWLVNEGVRCAGRCVRVLLFAG